MPQDAALAAATAPRSTSRRPARAASFDYDKPAPVPKRRVRAPAHAKRAAVDYDSYEEEEDVEEDFVPIRKTAASKKRRGSSDYDPADSTPRTPVASTSAAIVDSVAGSSPLSSLASPHDEDEEMDTRHAGPSKPVVKRVKTMKKKPQLPVAPRTVEKNFSLVIESRRRTPVSVKAKGKGKAVKNASRDLPVLPGESSLRLYASWTDGASCRPRESQPRSRHAPYALELVCAQQLCKLADEQRASRQVESQQHGSARLGRSRRERRHVLVAWRRASRPALVPRRC